jgi:TonB family protein
MKLLGSTSHGSPGGWNESRVAKTAIVGLAGGVLHLACYMLLLAPGAGISQAQTVPGDVAPEFTFEGGNGDGYVSPPTLIHWVDPIYTQRMKKAQYEGICAVSLVVDVHGVPQDVHVVRPLGMGLDESAIRAVRQYRFSPAINNGKPIAVKGTVNVRFKKTAQQENKML